MAHDMIPMYETLMQIAFERRSIGLLLCQTGDCPGPQTTKNIEVVMGGWRVEYSCNTCHNPMTQVYLH
jgi:hypothetical protein